VSTEKLYVVPDRDELPRIEEIEYEFRRQSRSQAPARKEINPAMAFTYSLLFWGGGQLHNNQDWLGFALAVLMFVFYGCLAAAAIWWDVCLDLIRLLQVDISYVYTGTVAFSVMGLTVWFSSAAQAYLKAAASRVTPFDGVNSRFFPFLCSLLIPGWGQFLNGQLKKGTLFLLTSLAGYTSASVALVTVVFWPILDGAAERVAVEWVLVPALFLLPAFLLVSLISSYDALRVSLDEIKKEPLRKRLEYANNRRRMQGWRRGVWPQIRLTMGLTLVLCVCLAVAYHMIPTDFYILSLSTMRNLLADNNMTVMAGLVGKAISLISV